jgi:nucleoside-diphosphate-sugar epimerase
VLTAGKPAIQAGEMMRALVTGAAGFIGSHLAEALAGAGWDVVGVDCLTPYYDVTQKRANVAELSASIELDLIDADLRNAPLEPLLDGVEAVFHQAGQPGVRASWDDFESYVEHNILATRRLLEAVRAMPVSRFVYASSSSVYGDALSYPTREDTLPKPQSPYGVSKLAAEHLCAVYTRNWGVPVVSLRYFTVFGPRQRPDMATHRLIEAAVGGGSFPMYGTGNQVRDFTYVADVVAANVAAATAPVEPGTILNIAGGGAVTLAELVATVERITGRAIELDRLPEQKGDVHRTGGATDAARSVLGWVPVTPLEQGVERQVAWHRRRRAASAD